VHLARASNWIKLGRPNTLEQQQNKASYRKKEPNYDEFELAIHYKNEMNF